MEQFLYFNREKIVASALILVWLLFFSALATNAQHAQEDFYLVRKGDTPYGIAKSHQMSVEELYRLNPGLRGGTLALGQKIRLDKGQGKSAPNKGNASYTIEKGDTWYSLSKKYGVGIAELQTLNGAIPQVGKSLVLPASGQQASTENDLSEEEAKQEVSKCSMKGY